MDNKTKLLAEQYLYEAASRFFEEPDCVELAQMNESKKLDEKLVRASLPDGRTVMIDDDDYENFSYPADTSADEYLGDDVDDVHVQPGLPMRYTGAASKAAAKAAALAKSTSNFATRTEAGQEIFNTYIKPKLDVAIKDAAKMAIEDGLIAYDQEGQYWDASGLDFSVLRAIQNDKLWPVFNQAARENGLSTVDKNKALAAYKSYLGHQANLGGDTRYNTLKRMMTKDAATAKVAPAEEAPVEAPVAPVEEAPVTPAPKKKRSRKKVAESAFVKDFFKACNEVLAEEYSERYDVSLDEATKMFILNDTLYE